MPNPFLKSEAPKGNPFVKKNPFVKEEATWGETLGAIPEQFAGGMKQAAGGMLQHFGEKEKPTAPDEMPINPVTGAPMMGSPWTGKRERELLEKTSIEATAKGEELFKKGEEQIKEATPENQTFWQEATSTAAQSFGTMAPLALAAAVTKKPGLVAGGFGVQEFGRSYGEARSKGLSPSDATRHATISGMIEGGTEYLPGKQLFKSGGFSKRFVNFMARELPGENIAEIGQMVNDYASGLREDITGEDVIDTIKMTSAATLIGGSVQTAGAQGLVKATEAVSDLKKKGKDPDTLASMLNISEDQLDARVDDWLEKGERRQDQEKRQQVGKLKDRVAKLKDRVKKGEASPDELITAIDELHTELTTDRLTGLKNVNAWEEAEPKAAAASIDLDGLKWINDEMGHEKGDEMFRKVGEAFRTALGDQVFRKGGDEFIAQHDDPAVLQAALESAQKRLADATIEAELPDGSTITKQGIDFTFVIDNTYKAADDRLKQAKEQRSEEGLRAQRGGEPPGVARTPAQGDVDQTGGPAPGGELPGAQGDAGLAQQGASELNAVKARLASLDKKRLSNTDKRILNTLVAQMSPIGGSKTLQQAIDFVKEDRNFDRVSESVREILDSPTALKDEGPPGTEQTLAEQAPPTEGIQRSPERQQTEDAARAVLAEQDVEKYARNINLERINSTEELDNAFTAIANTYGEPTVVSHEEVKDDAKALGLSEKDIRRWDRKEGLTREKMLAARQVLVESGNDLVEKAKAAEGGDVQALMAFKGALERHNALMAKVSGMTAEAGRILNQFNITADAAKGSLKAIENIMDSSGDKLKQAAELMSKLDDPASRNKFAQEVYRAKTGDVLIEAWINALLSGPATHMVNITSNTLVSWLTSAEHFVAAGVGKVTGGQITFREARANAAGWVQGAMEGMQAAHKAFVTENPADPSTKLEQRRHKAISSEALGLSGKTGRAVDVAGQGIRLPGRFLMAEDEFFKGIGRRQSLNALATRQAINEGLRGDKLAQRVKELTENPSDEMLERAKNRAEYQTFTNPLGPMGRPFMRFVNSHPALKLIVPFVRTPTNIVKFAGVRSPLAPLSKNVRDSLRGKGPVERELALARIMTGSAIWGSAAYLASLGLITGGGPDEPEAKAAFYRSGKQPYSVNIGGKYYSYARLEPIGMLLGTAASAVEIWDKATQAERDEMASMIVVSSVGAIGDNLLSKTWLKGVSDLFQAINDPERYGQTWIQSFGGTVVPTAVAQVARVDDPYLRRVENLTDAIKSRVPGKRDNLLPRLNLWGEPIKLEGGVGPDILSPVYVSTDKEDLVEEELQRLEVFPRMPEAKIGKVELTPEQHNEYIQLAGAPAKAILDQALLTPEYRNMPDFMRQKFVKKVVDKKRDQARDQMLMRYPELLRKGMQKKVEPLLQ